MSKKANFDKELFFRALADRTRLRLLGNGYITASPNPPTLMLLAC